MKLLLAILCILQAPLALARSGRHVLASIPSPGPCVTGLTWARGHLWAADHKTDTLYEIDPKTGAVLKKMPSPGYRPAGLAWDGKRLWNVDPRAKKIFRIDTGRGVTDRTLDAPVSGVRSLAWDGEHLWLAAPKKRRLHRIDQHDGTTLNVKRTPGRSAPGMVHDGRYLWITDRVADRIHLLHPPTGEVLFSIEAPGPHATGIAFDGKHLWVADYQTDRIYKLLVPDRKTPLRRARRRQSVLFTHQIRNLGPGTLVRADVFMAAPGDGPSQKLDGAPTFSPRPTKTLKDRWDQRIHRFTFKNLRPGAFATVTMSARATLHDVRHRVSPHRVKGLGAVPHKLRRYLRDGSKFLINDPAIRRAVKKAVGKEKNPYWIARKIYRHVHDRMRYKLSGGWNVAPRVLERGNGSCSEYSFLFIAMCRAAGLPARYVGALVVRKDDASYDDVFHRWVEVYLPGYGWLPVDPSRGDKNSEVARADAFGHLEPAFLVTTRGGGGSRFLGWNYNSDSRWVCKGRCEVAVETIAEWTPRLGARRGKKKAPGVSSPVCR